MAILGDRVSIAFLDTQGWRGREAGPRWALLALVFCGASLAVLREGLTGPFLSDDFGNIVWNPWIQELSFENLKVILDPYGEVALYTANYAPVHMFAHALEWAVFGVSTTGYHVVNVLLHGIVSTLLVAVFVDRGLPIAAALAGGALFLVHPANVEAVVWIFQLKTILALGFALVALLLQSRRPGLAAFAFALALLCKAQALFALPVAALVAWTSSDASGGARGNARWLWLWVGIAALYAWPQFFAFERLGESIARADESTVTSLRSAVANGARYLLLAATSIGSSVFHEPPRADSFGDPWWLAGLLFTVALGARFAVTLARRDPEAIWWGWAAAAFAPVSQLFFPFLYPMADRYLYLILPGLLGGALLLAQRGLAALPDDGPRRMGTAVAAGLLLVLVPAFALHAGARASVWRSNFALMSDAAANYPDGIIGHQMNAREAALRGDVDAVVTSLRLALGRGWDHFPDLQSDPAYLTMREHPEFLELERDVVRAWLDKELVRPEPTESSLHRRAQAFALLGELEPAVEAYEAAIRLDGVRKAELIAEVAPLRAKLRAEQRRAAREAAE